MRPSFLQASGALLDRRFKRRRHSHQDFGFLFQDYGRFELTIRQYVTLGVPGSPSEAAIWRALQDARADRLVARMPDGVDTQLGEQWHGRTISGGEWQRLALARVFLRLALARVFLRNAPVWILDEPTSAVDAATEEEVFACLAERSTAHSTLVVTHRASTLRHADLIHVMVEGRIVQTGDYHELCSRGGPFRSLFEASLPG